MIKNNKRGVSLIALVITIIVLIILVGIGYTASTFSIDRARFARFSTNFMNVQEAVRKKSATFDTEMVMSGKLITDGQKYNYIAKNGTSGDEIIDRNNVPVYSIIEKNADLGIELPDEKVNLPNKSNVEVKYAITSNGEVFSWPPTKRGEEYYITSVDVVSENIIGKSGDFEIFVSGKSVIITTDENGELLEGTILPTKDGKVMLSKPKIKGSYIYNGTVQTVSLTNYNSNVMNITNDTMKDAGTQTVTISLKDTERYLWSDGTTSSVSLIWTIDKKIVPVKWDVITSFIYDGTDKAPAATADGVEGETINLNVSGGATEIGTYTATASIQNVTGGNAENYILTNTTKDFRITKGTIEVTATGYEGEYDDQEHFITVNVIKPETGTTIYYSVGTILTENNYNTVGSTTNPGIKEMGTWTVYYYVVAQGRTSASGSKTITIVKANINPVISMTDYVYGETKSMPSIDGVKENANVTYYYNTTNTNVGGTNWNAVGSTTLNVGTYYIYAVVDETAHYYGAKTSAIPFAVSKKSLIVTADAKVKGFGQNDPAFTYTYTGNVNGQTPKFSGALTRQAGESVGIYPINQGTLSIVDNGVFLAGNYQISYNSANLTITARSIDDFSMILNSTSVVYSGAEQKPTATISYGGITLIDGTDYTLTYTNNINVGTATVTATGKGNYKGTISKTFQITKKAITVTADSTSKVYDGTPLTSTSGKITTGSLESGQTITITSTGTITNVGSTPNNISSVIIKAGSTDVTSNYTITKNAGTLTITKKSVAVTWGSTIVFTYDGKAHAPTASAAGVNGETINLTVTSAINAGSYTATATISSVTGGNANKNNYTLTGTTKAYTISPANITGGGVTISGTLKVGSTVTANLGTLNPSDCNVTYQWYSNTSNSTSGGSAISGATSKTCSISSSLKGKYIYVVVTASKTNYNTRTFSAISTASSNTYATVTCEHNWGAWTSDANNHYRTCSICGENDTRAHNWSAYNTTKAATCTTTGTQQRSCSTCGRKDSKTIAALGHDWGNWTTTKAATCTATGSKKRICSACSLAETTTIAATGHKWGEWVKYSPTCTGDGMNKRTCTVCSAEDKKIIPALGHTLIAATCVKPQTCTRCGRIFGSALDHDYSEATCISPKKCKRCGATSGSANGHDWGDWTTTKAATCTAAGSKKRTCFVCSQTETATIAAKGHSYSAATCTKPKTCSKCGATSGSALGHTWGAWINGGNVGPTGHFRICSRCNTTETKGHSFSAATVTKAATCTEDGRETKSCSVCGCVMEFIIKATGHSYKDATCIKPKTCSKCGATSGSANGHDWGDWTTTKAATCTTAGSRKRTCFVCSQTQTGTIAAKGHNYSAATCTKAKKCSRCGATSGSALGHSYSAATCTSAKKCSRCGATSGSALGHSYSAATCTKPRTCSRCGATTGSKLGHKWVTSGKVRRCSRCGLTRSL